MSGRNNSTAVRRQVHITLSRDPDDDLHLHLITDDQNVTLLRYTQAGQGVQGLVERTPRGKHVRSRTDLGGRFLRMGSARRRTRGDTLCKSSPVRYDRGLKKFRAERREDKSLRDDLLVLL